MNTLKEQDGRYYQEVEVVMLATDNKSSIIKDENTEQLNLLGDIAIYGFQHLYFLSDDEIKEGDWIYNSNGHGRENKLVHLTSTASVLNAKQFNYKKIIATTDESLKIEIDGNRGDLLPDVSFDIKLAKPSDSFISKYIEEYNAGRQITKVLVEYEKSQEFINIFHYEHTKRNQW